ncbi:uncharacterized protein LOC123314556 [Coccinella septempunctata]|uniref:uncharacterized protein LOC123314556 n=1 Tax=Coccinella septempunctata TaxID=41139 RepID=UPI001D08574F|nr:uncharacterized protein LOC123314556 [Coccinella septempunctata]
MEVITDLLILSVPIIGIAVNNMLNYNPEPIFNVYQRPNGYYWFKVTLMFIVLYIKKLINNIKLALESPEDLLKFYEKLEGNQELSPHKQAINAVHFNAANKDGNHLIVGMTRRKDKLIDGYIYIKINNEEIGLLESAKLPDTTLYQSDSCEGFEAEGLSVQCIEPMKIWRIKYQGKMKKNSIPSKTFEVDLEMTYTSNFPIINYGDDSDPLTTAKCIALERWSGEYFQLLKEYRQTQYEQHGSIEGYAIVNGETFHLDMDSNRIRSFGNKGDWRDVHRYNLHMFSTENGDRFTVGDFCFPLTMSSFKMGFVYCAKEKRIHPITYNDFQLYQHGESGKLPSDYAFTLEAGRKTYTVKVDVIDSPHFYISKDWESEVVKRLCFFNVNSMKGWGTSECQQRNLLGRSSLERSPTLKMKNSDKKQKVHASEMIQEERTKSLIQTNVKHVNDQKKLACEHCEKVCDSRVDLWKHLRTHDDKTKP